MSHEDFEQVYLQYSDKIFRFVYFKTNNVYLAEDITSEVFVRAWKNWEKFKPDYTKAWFYKIAGNLLIDHWRREKNKKNVSLEKIVDDGFEPSNNEDLIEKISKDEKIKKLNKALESLPENLREVAILRFIEGMSGKEVSEILGLSEVNVRVLQHRALLKLKEVFKNE